MQTRTLLKHVQSEFKYLEDNLIVHAQLMNI